MGWIEEPPQVQAVQATTQPQGFLVGSEQAEHAATMGYRFLVSGLRVIAHFYELLRVLLLSSAAVAA